MQYKEFLKSFGKSIVSGIYAITCLLDRRVYIGSAIDVRHRIWNHTRFLKAKNHGNKHIQKIYDKYGYSVFDFNLIILVDNDEDLLTKEVEIQDCFCKSELLNISHKYKDINLSDYYKDKFWRLVEKKNKNDCWEWQGKIISGGYGQLEVCVKNKKSQYLAHRISYTLFHDKQIGQMIIDHTCNNRRCVNPCHLVATSHHKNMIRSSKEGRMFRQKYSNEFIQDIKTKRKSGMSTKAIYEYAKYCNINISYSYLSHILSGDVRRNIEV